ncbi:uncharacterized protein LOC143674017 [Tamandua tetradactyla]|uniref:uncharacterized protein LOC143674017 n=1 Tax=Tamandua tetradactyla TaxID=48850 RepID=UPI004053FEF8
MGSRITRQQAPQVRALAALLDTHKCKVSVKQLQVYWDLLLPFNPWLVTCHLWSIDTYDQLIARVMDKMEHEGKRFPPGLLPTLLAIRSCLQGSSPLTDGRPARARAAEADGSDSESDSVAESLLDQLNNRLEVDPPRDTNGGLPASSLSKEQSHRKNLYPALPKGSGQEPSCNSLPPNPLPPPPELKKRNDTPSTPPLTGEEPGPPSYAPPPPFCETRPSFCDSGATAAGPVWPGSPPVQSAAAAWPTEPQRPLPPPVVGCFPMNLQPTQQCPLAWYPHSAEAIKQLRKAVKEDGFASPYATHLLEEMSTQLNTPHDWTTLARAILTPGQYVDWKAHFNSEAERAA